MSTFVPGFRYISDISKAKKAIVTFTEAHQFSNGEILSFRVSTPYGMVEMNNLQGRVLDSDTLTVTVDIDTYTFTAFIDAGIYKGMPALAVAAGSGVIPNYYPPTINLQDVFDNKPD